MAEQALVDKQASQNAQSNGLDDLRQDVEKYLTFLIDEHTFGTEVFRIKEIIEYCQITYIPITHDNIRGVINLRGNVVPVIDMAIRLDKQKSEVTKRTCIIIVDIEYEGEQIELGFVADEINEVQDVYVNDILPAPSFGAEIRPEFIRGMLKKNEKFIVLLNIEEVLSIRELSELVASESERS